MASQEQIGRCVSLARALNHSQRQFIFRVLRGEAYGEAYHQVYGNDNWQSCRQLASRLMALPKVKAFAEAITRTAVESLIINREEILANLRDVAVSGVTQGPGAGARVSACKVLLDAMEGGEKHTVTLQGPGGKPVQQDVRVFDPQQKAIDVLAAMGIPIPSTVKPKVDEPEEP